ncbi:S9 family peptidase [Granulicella tundricola]|uniref:WD40-like beta Propeller containing protein n=1 Tax=Granulicella tundricola (strain ATCC BAA-1859 / DSM 23138 / MP5ACTX9) TaxID=1198114 RepID=E8X338_GRATM|nr:S9 family peptidase [Granulicella tundricola]ADW69262.1 WD40-like beta Propeller containing protein [Granulicella tundricola MP5ACTX9]
MRRVVYPLLALISLQANAQKRPITEKDLFSFVWIGDVQLSPTSPTVAFVQTTVSPDHSGYETALYTLDTATPNATPHRVTLGTRDQSPRWSPDGKQLAFIRSVEKDGHPTPPQLYLVSATSPQSPIKLTDLPKGASAPQWAPSGTAIAVESSTPQDQAKARLEATKKSRATGDEAHVSDIRIVNREVYRLNGEGNLDPTFVPQLYLVSLPKADGTQEAPWQLTGGRFGVEEYTWRPGSNWIFYTSTHEDEPYYDATEHNTLYGIEASQSTHPQAQPPAALTAELPLEAHGLALSPDGAHLAFHAEAFPIPPAKPVSHQQSDLFVLDLAWKKNAPTVAGAPRNLTVSKGYEMGSGVGGDNTAPRGGGRPAITWTPDSTHLLDVAGNLGSALLMSIDATTGDMTRLTARKQAVLNFTANSKDLIALVSNPIVIGDLYRIGQPSPEDTTREPIGLQTPLTHVNETLFSQLDLTLPQDIKVTPTVRPMDIPFVTIDTFVQLPPSFPMTKDATGAVIPAKPAHPYPTILNIHGGPHSAYGWVFDHEMLTMAARGYVVVYPNPRGSTTYGQNFANIIESNYPGDDFHDLMDTMDAVVAAGWSDPDKLGVTGGSGGGLLTDWTVTQTNRFKAAVAQRDIVDQAAWWYTADIGEFHQYWMPPAPFDNLEIYKAHSPITFINNIKTPMMFILGDADYRTPPTSGGEEFFRYLKYRKIPTVMVRFPRESHELSRSGEPWHRIERLENITAWFDKFLLNTPEPQYDIPTP